MVAADQARFIVVTMGGWKKHTYFSVYIARDHG